MNDVEAQEVAARIKSAWPSGYMDESMVIHWAEFLQQYSPDDAARALTILQRQSDKLPSQGTFANVIDGEVAHRVKCPKCGLGFRTEARMEEHVGNVHWS